VTTTNGVRQRSPPLAACATISRATPPTTGVTGMERAMPEPVIQTGKPDYAALEFPPPPADRPYVIVNMVSSVDGKVVIEGTERGLGSKVDQQLMRELRVHADVVMNGAGTLRASGTSSRVGNTELEARREREGKSRHPVAAVLSESGNLPLDRLFFTARDFDAVVFVTESTPPDRRAAIEATGRRVAVLQGDGTTEAMLHWMRREFDARLLLVEGGPTLNGALFAAGLVDEYFTTIGSVVVGGNGRLTAVRSDEPPSLESATRLALVSAFLHPETSEAYLRYRVIGRGAVER